MLLTKKTFTTLDNNGCEFRVHAFYSELSEDRYYAIGLNVEAETLEELKRLVADID